MVARPRRLGRTIGGAKSVRNLLWISPRGDFAFVTEARGLLSQNFKCCFNIWLV